MTALAAARMGDEIAHGFGLAAMIAGAVVGAVAGAAIVSATALTGGLAAVVIAGSIAAGGLSMGQIVSGLSTIFNLPEPTSGVIAVGSPNVQTNKRPAARASLSTAGSCNGLPFNHPPLPLSIPVQQGSLTVMINGQPASRLKDKLMCGAHIKAGSPNVLIGGETTTVGFIFDLEAWTKKGLEILGLAALIGGGLFAAAAGVAALGTYVAIAGGIHYAMKGLGAIGDALGPGYSDLLQGIAGMGLVIAGPKLARGAADEAAAARTADEASTASPSAEPATIFQPKKIGQLEDGAVPSTPELEAARQAATTNPRQVASDPSHPPLEQRDAITFEKDGAKPWNGDDEPTTLYRVIDGDSNPAGSFWTREPPPADEASWRGGAAVKNDWNGDGGYVTTTSEGLKGWIGPAAPQKAAVDGYILPGHSEQIWIPAKTMTPTAPQRTPWNPGK